MNLYRIAKSKFIDDLTGEGARLYGGRWNHPGIRMIYCSQSSSLCLLELLAHMSIRQMPNSYSSFEAFVPDHFVICLQDQRALDADWRANPPKEFTKEIGTEWITSKESVGLRVPSAILPSEHNVLVNPEHPDFKFLKINHIDVLDIDPRIY